MCTCSSQSSKLTFTQQHEHWLKCPPLFIIRTHTQELLHMSYGAEQYYLSSMSEIKGDYKETD